MEEIEKIISKRGLVGALREIDSIHWKDTNIMAGLAEAVSRRPQLLSEQDIDLLENLTDSEFFNIQIPFCKMIPILDAPVVQLMELVHLLVEKGGDDLAATQPYEAFRKWCATSDRRADEVTKLAGTGDVLALDFLVFALEAKGDVQQAFASAQADGQERIAGISALSRMNLTLEEAKQAIRLMLKVAQSAEPDMEARSIKAALDTAVRHPKPDRKSLSSAHYSYSMSGRNEQIIIHLMAAALNQHAGQLSPEEVQSCVAGIINVDPENKGTVTQVDWALGNLWKVDTMQAGKTAEELIARNEGRIGWDDLPAFFTATKEDEPRNLARLATEWLLKGNEHACSVLDLHLHEANRTTPFIEVNPEDLPDSADEHLFLCRKAVGFLFTSPMTAAAWIVAVLRGGHPDAADKVADLLFDPLLLNYSGELRGWLEREADAETRGQEHIKGALERAQKVWDGFEAARELVELVPPAAHRSLIQFQEAEEAVQVQEMAQKKSLLGEFVPLQTLLYGDRVEFIATDSEGNRRPQTVPMTEISVTVEHPKGIFHDPVGTEKLIENFKLEPRHNE